MSVRPLPRGPLKAVIVGAFLVAWEPNVLLKGFPLGVALQLLGLLAALAAGWKLRDDLPPPWLGALGALLGWGATRGLIAVVPSLAHYRSLFDLLAIAGFLLAAHALRERARGRGQTLAFACWTHALIGGAVGLGLPVAAGLVTLALGGLGIETPEVFRHHPAAVILLLLVSAAPVVLFLRAAGWTLREESDAASATEGWLPPLLTHPAGAALLLALFLTPVWLLLPSWRHFATTPTFSAYLKQASSARRSSTARTQAFNEGRVLPVPEEGNLPDGVFGTSSTIELELKHGDESLLWVEHELVVTLDAKRGEIMGREAGVRGLSWDPRFSLVGASKILKAPLRAGDEGTSPTTFKVPFELTVELASSAAPARFDVQAAESVTPPTSDDQQQVMIANALGLPVQQPESPWLSIPALVRPAAPPPPEEGLRYTWQIRGWVELQGPAQAGGGWQARLIDEVVFTPNSQAYSYAMEARSKLRTNQGGVRLTHTTKRRTSKRLTWNGKVW